MIGSYAVILVAVRFRLWFCFPLANMKTCSVILVWIFLHVAYTAPSVQNCPPYVLEGHDLNCTCEVQSCNSTAVKVTWPGRSDTAHLVKVNVTRNDSDEYFTCQEDCGGNVTTANYSLRVYYPPTEPPVIHGYTAGQILKAGDNMSCTVPGGKPLVSAVIFYCIDPKIEDLEDHVGVLSVTSPLVMNTTLATSQNMTCLCKANWSPIFAMYQLSDSIAAQTEYKAELDQFTINGSSQPVTVYENVTSISITCAATGRLAPTLNLTFEGYNDPVTLTGQVTSNGRWQRALNYTISTVACDHMGVYTCFADNGFPDLRKSSLQLSVNCHPRLHSPPNNRYNPPELTGAGLNFTLLAYPLPSSFNYTLYRFNMTTVTNLSSDLFSTIVTQIRNSSRVQFSIRKNGVIPDDYVGLYGVTVSNELGGVEIFFEVINKVKASFVEFHINGSYGVVTLKENEKTAIVTCDAKGRPSPNLTLTFEADKDAVISTTQHFKIGEYNVIGNYTMPTASSEIMGIYTCIADNGFPDPAIRYIQLNINSTLKFPSSATLGTKPDAPAVMTTNGLNLTLIGYPLPYDFLYSYNASGVVKTINEGIFNISFRQVKTSSVMEGMLTMSGLNSTDVVGKFSQKGVVMKVSMTNYVNGVDYFFRLEGAEAETASPVLAAAASKTNVPAIVGGVVGGGGAFIIIVVIIVVVTVRRNGRTKGTTVTVRD